MARLALVPFVLVACGSRTQLDDDHIEDATTADQHPLDAAADAEGGDATYIPPHPSIATQELTCVVQMQGNLKCWGQAPLGDGTETNAYGARAIPSPATSRIATLGLATCALGTNTAVSCWGRANNLELGLGLDTSSIADDAGNVPLPTALVLPSVVMLSGGKNNACAVTAGGDAFCWGQVLGDHQTGLPTAIAELSGKVTQIAEGDDFQCAVLHDATIKCWGANNSGQLGVGHVSAQETIGVSVIGITDAIAIAAGAHHACALRQAGGVMCWGEGTHGELGDGIEPDGGPRVSTMPANAIGLGAGVVAVRAGGHTTCAVESGGGAKCWGANQLGNIGDGTVVSRALPTDVLGLQAGVVDVAVSQNRTCAVMSDGSAKCWGAGPLGDGDASITGSPKPVNVVGLP